MKLKTILTGKQTGLANSPGFTIVELLMVIAIIAILAAITIVSYTGITTKANQAALTSDLTNAKKQLSLYYSEHGIYPTSLQNGTNCLTNDTLTPNTDTNYCLKPSSGTTLTLYPDLNSNHYSIKATKGSLVYSVTDTKSPSLTINTTADTNWLTLGSQTWAKTNLNIGTMVTGITSQTNNNILEKYCYNNDEASCTTYGALYQWDEAMQYTTTEGAQGVCPTGSHIPSDDDWKTLEMQLGMSQEEADATGYRGTDQGAQLKIDGTSGLNVPFSGHRDSAGLFYNLSSSAYLWSSSKSSSSSNIWRRHVSSGSAAMERYVGSKYVGFPLRCLAY